MYVFVVFRREIVMLDWKKWNGLRDDLNDDELHLVYEFLFRDLLQ